MAKRPRGKQSVEKLLHHVETPLFVLSAKRQVSFFNTGCERLTDWSADKILGQTCDYAVEPDHTTVQALAAAIAPPPEVWLGQPASVPAYLPKHSGDPLPRLLNYFPLLGNDGTVESVMGIITLLPAAPRVADTTPSRRLHAELASLRTMLRQRFGIKSLVCRSPSMLRVLEQIRLAKESSAAVFLQGEGGTGKEHVARTIHYESELRARSFMPLDCRKLPPFELKQAIKRFLESGRIESDGLQPGAAGSPALKPGTIFLSHVEQLPRDLQEMLVDAFGPDRAERRTDLRLMASSTVDLSQALESETLRSDFYYLLTALRMELPPLRRRNEDLPLLAQAMLEESNRGDAKQVGGFAEEVWEKFREYNWPGNVEELRVVVDEARSACTETVVRTKDLPFRFRTGLEAQAVGPLVTPRPMPLEPLLERIEKEQIELALSQARQNKSKAAELLGLTRPRLYRRMEALGIEDRENNET